MIQDKRRVPLKWAGSKFASLDKILPHISGSCRLVEPFVGAGNIFINASNEKFLISDANADLINFYKQLKRYKNTYINEANKFFSSKNNTKEKYYFYRSEFNLTHDLYYKAILFLYLNRHGYRGIIRYNSSGMFNVPFGYYKEPLFPFEALQSSLKSLKKAKILESDFAKVMANSDTNDLLYCDPPYIASSSTANFTEYCSRKFTIDDQIRLASQAEDLKKRGITVLVSNIDTPESREIFSLAKKVIGLAVKRNISCKTRKTCDEALFIY